MNTIRVASHVHSNWSYDGSWSLERIATAFGRARYDAVLMAEHDRGFDADRWAEYRDACGRASTDRLLLVPGIEYSDPSNTIHMPVWGDIPFLGEGLEPQVLLTLAEETGGMPVLAHPGRRHAVERLDPAFLSRLVGIELWNRKYDGYAPSRVAADLLSGRPELIRFVSLDFHTARQFHPLAMTFEIDGGLDAAAIWSALYSRRVSPRALGLPADRIGDGVPGAVLRTAEQGRRITARALRRSRQKFAGRRSFLG
jgi:hypothetical protein